jgi:hypothetical protein
MRHGSKVAASDACTGGVATEYGDVVSGGRRHGRLGVATACATRGAGRRGLGAAQGTGSTVRMDQWALAGLGMRAQRGRGVNAARRRRGRAL